MMDLRKGRWNEYKEINKDIMKSRYEISAASLRGLRNASRNGEVISLLSNWLSGDGISWNETQKVQLYERFTRSDLYISGLRSCEKAGDEMKTDGSIWVLSERHGAKVTHPVITCDVEYTWHHGHERNSV